LVARADAMDADDAIGAVDHIQHGHARSCGCVVATTRTTSQPLSQ